MIYCNSIEAERGNALLKSWLRTSHIFKRRRLFDMLQSYMYCISKIIHVARSLIFSLPHLNFLFCFCFHCYFISITPWKFIKLFITNYSLIVSKVSNNLQCVDRFTVLKGRRCLKCEVNNWFRSLSCGDSCFFHQYEIS